MKKTFGFLLIFVLGTVNFVLAQTPVATLNGQPITEAEVKDVAGGQMLKIMSQMYEIKYDAVHQIIENRLLDAEAKKQGLTLAKLKEQVMNKAPKSTVDEAKAVYEMQKNQRFKEKAFEDIKPMIMGQLDGQKKMMALNDYIDGLKKKAQIKINLERPRVEVKIAADDPFKGVKGAPITLIEFSEFQCPYCKKTRSTIDQILKKYGDKVYYVFRDYPLGFHNQAKDAANAAHCAGDQGKYWEFNSLLWNFQGQHTSERLEALATELKLDNAKFKQCMTSKKYYPAIDKDQTEGENAGVTGTPAYFINGIFLSGAQPYEAFQKIIDEELSNK